MGRAFPEIQMLTCTMYGVSATPMAMADEKGNSLIINTINNRWTEAFARTATMEMGATAMIALYAMSGKQLKEGMILGTLTLAETIGRSIREAVSNNEEPIQNVLDLTNGYEVFRGKVTDVRRQTVAGFAKGEATFAGVDAYADSQMVLNFQNEHLVAIQDGEIVVSTPDLITVLDADTGEPITTEGLRYGFRVVVIGMPCDPKWRTPEGLELVGPKYFGYEIEYTPVEQRYG